MVSTIKYDIFQVDATGKLMRIEAVEGLEQATNRVEKLSESDPTLEYFLYCPEAGKVVLRIQRKSARRYDTLDGSHQKQVG